MKRLPTTELLDTDAGTPAEIAASLADLCRINRWFGGINTSEALIERVARRHGVCELSLLEIVAGSGGVPKLVAARLGGRGITVRNPVLDRTRSQLNVSKRGYVAHASARTLT